MSQDEEHLGTVALAADPKAKVAEVRVSKLAANVVGTLLTILFCIAGVLFAHIRPLYVPCAEWHVIPGLVLFISLLPIHEALHALGLRRFAGVS